MDSQEQYSKVDNVVITGLKALSYAAVIDDTEERDGPNEHESNSVQARVLALFNTELKCNVKETDISAVHYLKRKNGKKDIIVKFVSRQMKDDIMKKRGALRNRQPPVYINDHLTENSSKLAFQARQMKRQGRVLDTWTRNCKIFVKFRNNELEEPKVIQLKSMTDLARIPDSLQLKPPALETVPSASIVK